ncbi:high affinity nicotinic acid plasma membrane permease [Metschnikowia bicuspidata var. bicuspidata NRRL YB-4993]|uniref:High affinity nicotinic acid plasma membrane permease n=1 Tax=Metschnikowia bicuspidata var. bicuspidata NRRL YB-4993 TaxID=869754 RepID=A0A1A0HEV1_9ASCO|nr:high affinity nicotinic acid plasma membrane permease [Metschnikowia bicuspidata var. bicuspidata NRRL YB-4993]OBA22654.1 high affinity nicotinic acid plasma membrane permease [Metschnikowia bicuspidata var. bicuspidata NRRL YB-4993]
MSTEVEDKQLDQSSASLHIKEESVGSFQDEATKSELDRIYRKLDRRIIPALWCLYFLTSFGSSAYGTTLTMNSSDGHSLGQKLDLTSKDTSTASALYYVGYIIFDVPMNLIMTKVSPQSWLARIVITVGLVYSCYIALESSGALIAVRFISGVVGAGTWPGMSYYISLWYPNERLTRRIGYYFTAAQISAAAAGLLSAAFQKMDGIHGYTGWQWLYLVYGCVTIVVGISLLWWLPDRPYQLSDKTPGKYMTIYNKYFTTAHPLNPEEREIHRKDIQSRYVLIKWTWKDVSAIFLDLRLWPIIMMYFGVVGTGFGLAVFGSTIIAANNPSLSSINVSLLYAPIWLFDLAGILLITPFADRYKKHRAFFFSGACLIIITGMFVTTFANGSWNRYGGLLIAGFGLGPTVPICMSWSAEIFGPVYGDSGIAVSSALVSGLGNLGSVTATYALYRGWPSDAARLYRNSNMVLVAMLGISIIFSFVCHFIKDRVGRTL